jgi:murein DD-endopeptidase MepM/ murein hydrolase activator NlpD
MRRVLFITSIILLAALLTSAYWTPVSDATHKIAHNIFLSWKIARLYARDPDQKLFMPIHTAHAKQVKDSWHAPRDGSRLHEGQDIFAPRGTPVYSATEGYIVRIGENQLGGHTISVLGAGGRVYYYAHLNSYAANLAEGDYVTPETVLGSVGTTGNAQGTQPHLHFGVYTPAGAMNPLPLLSDKDER